MDEEREAGGAGSPGGGVDHREDSGRGGVEQERGGEKTPAPRPPLLLRLFRRRVDEREVERLREEERRLREEYKRLKKEVEKLRKEVEEHEALVKALKARDERALAKAFRLFRDWFEETHEIIAVETLKRSLERPPIWWQWLMLLVVGALGGLGLGFALAINMIHGTPIPIHVVCRP